MENKDVSTIHNNHRQRVRERYLKEGIDSFEAHQILELILFYTIGRKDTNEIAHSLLDKFGSLSNVFESPCKELMKVKGVGEGTAVFLNLISQLTRKYYEDKKKPRVVLKDTLEAGKFAVNLFKGRIYECFFLICLDAQNRVIHSEKISEGTLDTTPVYPRNIVKIALQHNAYSVILAHNHPGGSKKPSDSDLITTDIVNKVLKAIGIPLFDHIIVADDLYTSFKEEGLL